jgi:hypothetical protein
MKVWWNEIKNYSYRDQFSLNYAIWKSNINIKIYYFTIKKISFFIVFSVIPNINNKKIISMISIFYFFRMQSIKKIV